MEPSNGQPRGIIAGSKPASKFRRCAGPIFSNADPRGPGTKFCRRIQNILRATYQILTFCYKVSSKISKACGKVDEKHLALTL
jgi:hypothetical protein